MSASVKVTPLTTLPSTATAADIYEATERDGGVIVEQVLSPDLRGRINAELDPYVAQIDPVRDYDASPDGGGFMPNTKRLEGLVQKSDAVVEAILDERYLAWATMTLDWAEEIQFSAGQLIEIGPGEPPQSLHRDDVTWPQLAGGPHHIIASCMLALSDFTEECGATRVVPGSNRDQALSPYTLDVATHSVPAVMKAGSALFFTGKLIHGGGANRTTDVYRRGLTLTCSLGWLKPEEAQTLAVTPERAQQLPRRMRELCSFAGYRAYGMNASVYSHRLDMTDPYRVLFGERR